MAYLAALSLSRGMRAGSAAVVGIALGYRFMASRRCSVSVQSLKARELLYETLRWAGVADLLYLAWEAGVAYVDWRGSRRHEAMMRLMKVADGHPFAPPFLRARRSPDRPDGGDPALSRRRGRISCQDPAGGPWTQQMQLTDRAIYVERGRHGRIHPPCAGRPLLRRPESGGIRRAKDFRQNRIPKSAWLRRFDRNPAGIGIWFARLTYADHCAFQVVEGLILRVPPRRQNPR